jgi:hypothetical protein
MCLSAVEVRRALRRGRDGTPVWSASRPTIACAESRPASRGGPSSWQVRRQNEAIGSAHPGVLCSRGSMHVSFIGGGQSNQGIGMYSSQEGSPAGAAGVARGRGRGRGAGAGAGTADGAGGTVRTGSPQPASIRLMSARSVAFQATSPSRPAVECAARALPPPLHAELVAAALPDLDDVRANVRRRAGTRLKALAPRLDDDDGALAALVGAPPPRLEAGRDAARARRGPRAAPRARAPRPRRLDGRGRSDPRALRAPRGGQGRCRPCARRPRRCSSTRPRARRRRATERPRRPRALLVPGRAPCSSATASGAGGPSPSANTPPAGARAAAAAAATPRVSGSRGWDARCGSVGRRPRRAARAGRSGAVRTARSRLLRPTAATRSTAARAAARARGQCTADRCDWVLVATIAG